jgi:2-keto-4-pentenoate hydratase/2-oxohepta-3-ene-1,7-dioic acid hydratase in catechol pathway
VGSHIKHCDTDAAREAVAGVTVGACLTIHDELPGLEAYKMFDDAMAVGPHVAPVDSVPLDSAEVSLSLDGERLAACRTDEWRFSPGELVAHVAEIVTFQPGDVVFTGDPTRIDTSVRPGDTIEATVEGVGTATVPIVEDETEDE